MANEVKRYILTGWAKGRFESEDQRTHEKTMREWFKIYVAYPVSDYRSEDYEAEGFKVEVFKALSADVWANVAIGEEVNIYFTGDDDKKKAALMTSTGRMVNLEIM